MSENNEIFQQDLEGEPGDSLIFMVYLLMKEKCPMPDKDTMDRVMAKHFGDVENYTYSEKGAGYSLKKYSIEFEDDKSAPVMIMISNCFENDNEGIGAFERSQMWDCENSGQILEECKYRVVANDMLGAGLDTHRRAEMITDYVEALLELYPTCEAVYFEKSGKMFTADTLRSCEMPRNDRFIHYAVNVRFFNIEDSDDMMVDTLGMGLVHMPDLQYHFHGFDPNGVVYHAYNMLSYIFENDCPIDNGDTIDGVEDDRMSMDVQWTCHYERSLIQPPRDVIDVCMGENASGQR